MNCAQDDNICCKQLLGANENETVAFAYVHTMAHFRVPIVVCDIFRMSWALCACVGCEEIRFISCDCDA